MAQVFKKRYPGNPVSLSTGKSIHFDDLGNEIGFFVTDNPEIIAEFQLCMKAGRGGIQLSSMAELEAAKSKKANSNNYKPSTLFREAATSGKVTDPKFLQTEAVVPLVAGADSLKEVFEPPKPEPIRPEPKPGWDPQPKLGRRKK